MFPARSPGIRHRNELNELNLMGTLGISHFSKKQWIRVIEWIAPEVQKIADWSVQQSRKAIKARGDQDKLEVMFDGLYLTRGHYSNNPSATMRDAKTGNIIGYTHRTKRGQGANWEGTSDRWRRGEHA